MASSSVAPSLPLRNWQFHVVEMPGPITSGSPDMAIAALGGMDAITRAFSQDLVPLELRLRPEDPFSHPILGEVISTSNLLLRVSKKRKKVPSGPNGTYLETDYRFDTEIVGLVTKTGRFRALADFQYLVNPEDPMFKLKQSLNEFDINGISNFEFSHDKGVQPDLRMIPPPSFSRIEWSLGYRYQQFTESTEIRMPKNQGGEVIKISHKPPRNPMIKFRKDTLHIPTAPTPAILSLLETRFPNSPTILARIQHLFTLRPIYTFRALFNQMRDVCLKKMDVKLVPFLLPKYAYFVTFGPWQECWVRYGYDPREDREARLYQIVSMRMVKGPKTLKRAKRSVPSRMGAMSFAEHEDDDKSHIFDGTLFKGAARMHVCDLTDPDVTRIVESHRGIRRTCEPNRDGWYETACLENIRKIVRRKILQQAGRSVDDKEVADFVSDDGEEEALDDDDLGGEDEEQDGDEQEEEEGTEQDDRDGGEEGGGDDDMELEPPVPVSAAVSSKIDALMKSLQSSQVGPDGAAQQQALNPLADDNEDDEFDYFEENDD
ncbi:tau 95 subunit of transcription factor TFIIIC [Podochytrium sp. JEL0797]|nr:tau 95 subunit of transcription factor TFIIIC [Podochytrium sp. JEL0797]